MAFKFPDEESLWIKCKLELCLQPHEHLSVDNSLSNALCRAEKVQNSKNLKVKQLFRNVMDARNVTLKKIHLMFWMKESLFWTTKYLFLTLIPRITRQIIWVTFQKLLMPLIYCLEGIQTTEWCILKSVLSSIIAFSATIYSTAIIAILLFYKRSNRKLEEK